MNYPHPFFQRPLDSRMGTLKVVIINSVHMKVSLQHLEIHPQRNIYI